ncbi:MAG: glycosyl hydrolase, partial [Acidobacteriota bacterium]
MRKPKHFSWYASLAFMVGAIAIGNAPISNAQEQLSATPNSVESAAAALPGVTVTGVHEGHLHYGLAAAQDDPNVTVDPEFFSYLSFRPTGFSRGGRATAVTGIPDEPFTFFAGYTGGGVWKTTDAGTTWENISDGYFGVGSIGDIKVAPSDPNVIWVGTGSGCPRGNISTGDGIYRSTDGGKTWAHVWSPGYVQIPEMVVDPQDPDHLYAAVLGDIFGPGDVRGIYETKDAGQNWERILFVSQDTGFNDIAMDPSNARILFASAWTVYRKPWTIHSGSDEGGIFRSKDGGATWDKLEGGLPTGMVGKIDVSVSPANPDRAWALIEAANDRGGVYRTDNGGDSWTRVNDSRNLQQRAWYYTHIYADPLDPDTVYALNTGAYKSTDGGRNFDTQLRPEHGDNHDLWLNPHDPNILINSNDGGANVSLNGGQTFSTEMNQPTAEFYRVAVDNAIPYRVYGAQQDNSTAAVQASFGGGRGGSDFYSVGGGESGHIAVDPRDANIIWAGSYGGNFTRMDRNTGITRSVGIYADAETGQQAADMKYRFQWNAPIRISPHDPNTVYITSQYVHRTQDDGVNWEVISPDLTTNNAAWQGYSGGEGITRDSTGVEVYTTIFAFEESPLTPGLLWAGSDDGLIHISRDDGVTWDDITPPDMPEGGTVNQIDMSVHDPGRA